MEWMLDFMGGSTNRIQNLAIDFGYLQSRRRLDTIDRVRRLLALRNFTILVATPRDLEADLSY